MQTLLHLIDAAAVMSMLALSYGIVRRQPWRPVHRQVLLGVAFGLGAITTMLQPILVVGDLIIDCRALFIGFAGAFLGARGASAAVLVAIAGRLSIGTTPSAIFGIGSLLVAAASGLLWRRFAPRFKPDWRRFAILGLMISSAFIVQLFSPSTLDSIGLERQIFLLTAYNIVGSIVLGSLMEREHAQETRENWALLQANTDPLTGVLNRRGFQNSFTLAESEQPSSGSALLLIDVDHFKLINDRYGHSAGDDILRITATRIRDCLRPKDSVLRFGGEEFGIHLTNLSEDQAWQAAERVRQRLATPYALTDGTVVDLTVSLGGWCWVTGRSSVATAFAAADQALYAAKSAGRNRTVFSRCDIGDGAGADTHDVPTLKNESGIPSATGHAVIACKDQATDDASRVRSP